MKKKRLKLDELKVNSFVTDEEKNKSNTLKGGSGSKTNKTTADATPCSWCRWCPGSDIINAI